MKKFILMILLLCILLVGCNRITDKRHIICYSAGVKIYDHNVEKTLYGPYKELDTGRLVYPPDDGCIYEFITE